MSVDSVMLERDLDGSTVTDFVVREKRVSADPGSLTAYRVAIYMDAKPGTGTPAYADKWDDEFGGEVLRAHYALDGSYGDYDSQTFLLVQRGQVREEIVTGQDYGRGLVDVLHENDGIVIDVSVMHLVLRGKEISSDLTCGGDTDYAAVRFHYDVQARQFVGEEPRCVKDKPNSGDCVAHRIADATSTFFRAATPGLECASSRGPLGVAVVCGLAALIPNLE